MAGGAIDEVAGGLTGVDHEAVGELHGLGTSSTELSRDNDLATLGTGLHDETKDTIAGPTITDQYARVRRSRHIYAPADGKATKELVAQALALSNGRKTTVLDLLGVELKRVVREFETLLDEGGELADATTLLTQNLLGVSGTDDDLETHEFSYPLPPQLSESTSVRACVTRTSQPE